MTKKNSMANLEAVNVEAAAAYLEALASGLRLGHVSLGSGEKQVDLRVPQSVTIDLEGKAHDGKKKSSFQVAMTWRSVRRVAKRETAAEESPANEDLDYLAPVEETA
jgi:amphi-Trp domain-containing protein